MSSVDNRIVNLKMNASQFMQAAQSAVGSLKTLEEKLRMTGVGKGIEAVAQKAKDLNFSSAIGSISDITNHFSIMETVGLRAITRLTDSVLDFGARAFKQVTIDPITDGFSEYETKMNAIQTFLTNTASKGTTLEDINAGLEELNVYADKTIYNLAQMIDNASKATAAGLEFEDSLVFVKGIANVAAGFGVGAQDMARATYQMTQALAAGSIKLMDWKSLETAGMGGEMLQNALVEKARAMGVYVDMTDGFRYSLEQGWLTTEVFMATLEDMANDPTLTEAATNVTTFTKLVDAAKEAMGSGWAVTWEMILGNKQQSTELFTAISNGFTNIVNPMAQYRNESLKLWNQEGGRAALLKGLANIAESLTKVYTRIWMAFKNVIDPYNSERLISISKAFEKFTEKIKLSGSAIRNVRKTFEGIFSVFKLIGMIIKPFISLFGGLLGTGGSIIDMLLLFTGTIGRVLTGTVNWIESLGILQAAADAFGWVGRNVAELVSRAFTRAFNFITTHLYLLEKAANFAKKWIKIAFEEISKWVQKGIEYATPYVNDFVENTLKPFGVEVKNRLMQAKEDFQAYLANDMPKDWETFTAKVKAKVEDFKQALIEFNEAYKPVEKIKDFVTTAFTKISEAFLMMWDTIQFVGGKVSEFLGKIWDGIMGADITASDVFNAGMFGMLILAAKKIIGYGKEFFNFFGSFKEAGVGALEAVRETAESFQKTLKANVLIKIAIALGLLAGAIILLSMVDHTSLGIAVVAIGGALFGIIRIVKKINEDLDSFKDTAKLQIAMNSLMKVAFSLFLVATAIKKLDGMDIGSMATAVVGLAALLGAMIHTMKLLEDVKTDPKVFKTLSTIGFGLMSIAGAFALLGLLPWTAILKGVTVLAVVLGEMVIFMTMLDDIKTDMMGASKSLIAIATGMLILSAAFWAFALMPYSTIVKGFGILTAVLIELGVFMRQMDKNELESNMRDVGSGLIKLAAGLIVLAVAFGLLALVGFWNICQGMLTLGVALGIFGVAVKNISGVNAVKVATGFVILGAGLLVLAMAFKKFEDLSWGAILKGAVGMVALLLALGVAAFVLEPLALALVPVAIGMAALAGACLLLGIALPILSTGLLALGGAFAASSAGIMAGIFLLASVIPILGASLGMALALALGTFITTLGYYAPGLAKSLIALVDMLLDVLIASIPKLTKLLVVLIAAVCKAIVDAIPIVCDTILKVLQALSDFLVELFPTLSQLLINLLDGLIGLIVDVVIGGIADLVIGILNKLAEEAPNVAEAFCNLVDAVLTAIGESIPKLVESGVDMIVAIIQGLADAVETKGPEVREACMNLVKAILDNIGGAFGDFLELGGYIVSGIAQGIWDAIWKVGEAASGIAKKAWDVVCDLLGIKSPSREFMKIGRFCDEGLAIGFKKYGDVVENEAIGVGEAALNGLSGAMSRVGEILGTDVSDQPVIRPVLDLSEIQNGAGAIDGMLGGNRSLGASMAGQISARIAGTTSAEDRMISAIRELKDTMNSGSGDTYTINGVTYDDGSNIATAVKDIVRAAKIVRRV